MPKYVSRLVVIDAHQLPLLEEDADSFMEWAEEVGLLETDYESGRDGTLVLNTIRGTLTAQPGDYIIKWMKGEFYPCRPDIFEANYQKIKGPIEPCKGWREYFEDVKDKPIIYTNRELIRALNDIWYPPQTDKTKSDG